MTYYNKKSVRPPKMPGLELVDTGERIIINGKECKIVKYVRMKKYK